MSLLRERRRTESALIPTLGPVLGNQHACATRPTSTARAASCHACRQRMGKGDESTPWGIGSGGRAELDYYDEETQHHSKSSLIHKKTCFFCQIACNFMTHHQGQMPIFLNYSLNPVCSHTQNSNQLESSSIRFVATTSSSLLPKYGKQ